MLKSIIQYHHLRVGPVEKQLRDCFEPLKPGRANEVCLPRNGRRVSVAYPIVHPFYPPY